MIDPPTAPALRVAEGLIEFDNVTFNYWRGEEGKVMENFHLTIRPGEKVGLVGRSGSGKSTLVNLMLRLFDVEGGSHPASTDRTCGRSTQESLRSAIGLRGDAGHVAAAPLGTGEHQVRPPDGDRRTDAPCRRAGQCRRGDRGPRRSGIGRRGFDAHVGERGVKLSGGQRQRVAIARVLLKDAPILVLDEATSALDSEVEAAIQDQLTSLMEGKTVIAIAHRLSTIAAMDRLVVLEKGLIVEEGTHAELLAKGGHYAKLWEHQSGGPSMPRPRRRSDPAPMAKSGQGPSVLPFSPAGTVAISRSRYRLPRGIGERSDFCAVPLEFSAFGEGRMTFPVRKRDKTRA